MSPIRCCPACGHELVRHEGEKRANFLKRVYCNFNCSVKGRALLAQERQARLDVEDTHTEYELKCLIEFDRSEILHRAHLAAPQIPISLLSDVITEVEPLIAANTRRKLMAQIAAKFRVDNPHPRKPHVSTLERDPTERM